MQTVRNEILEGIIDILGFIYIIAHNRYKHTQYTTQHDHMRVQAKHYKITIASQ